MKSAFCARFCVVALGAALSIPTFAQSRASYEKENCIDLMKKLNSTEQEIVYVKALETLVENTGRFVEYGKKLKERLSAETLKLISQYETESEQLRKHYLTMVQEYQSIYRLANGGHSQLYFDKMKVLNQENESKRRALNQNLTRLIFESLDKDMQTNFIEASNGNLTLDSRIHNYNLPTVYLTPSGYESFEKKDTYNKGKASLLAFHIAALAYLKDMGRDKKIGLDIELDANPFVIISKESEEKFGVLQLSYDVLNDQEKIFFFRSEKVQLKNKKAVLADLKMQRLNLLDEAISSGKTKQNLAHALKCVNELDIYSFLPDPKLAWGSKENKSVRSYEEIYKRDLSE